MPDTRVWWQPPGMSERPTPSAMRVSPEKTVSRAGMWKAMESGEWPGM